MDIRFLHEYHYRQSGIEPSSWLELHFRYLLFADTVGSILNVDFADYGNCEECF